MSSKSANRYQQLIAHLFKKGYRKGKAVVAFDRSEIEEAARLLDIDLPKNLGDIIYSFRYRNPLPAEILKTQPKGMEWIIEGKGRARYEFRLDRINRIEPNPNLITTKIPDSTPEIVTAHALSDEQALLAKIRYNRLIDVFLGITTCSLQNHLRTTVSGLGQIEIDEIYVGIDKHGCQYVIPVQAKGGSDRLSTVQTKQDIACCKEKFPGLICRSISTQFMEDGSIVIFELCMDSDDSVKIVAERHYRLVPSKMISLQEISQYRTNSANCVLSQ